MIWMQWGRSFDIWVCLDYQHNACSKEEIVPKIAKFRTAVLNRLSSILFKLRATYENLYYWEELSAEMAQLFGQHNS